MRTYDFLKGVSGGSPRDLQRKDPDYPRVEDTLFRPLYWTTNGEGAEDFVTVTNGNELYIPFRVYKTNTFIGAIWGSVDAWSHAGKAYDDYFDYTGVTWVFDFETSDTCPVINSETKALTLDIRNAAGDIFFLPLAPYADTPDLRTARITLDFDNLLVTRASDSEIIPLDPSDISRITIGCISDQYDFSLNQLLPAPVDCFIKVTTVSATGGKPFTVANHIEPFHNIGMCTAYDNMHIISPERAVESMKALGYNGKINHYCGVSQYPNKTISNDAQVMLETPGETINLPCREWHLDFVKRCQAEGWPVIFSISYEMYSPYANQTYAQRDRDGNLAVTGYSPASHLLIPTSTNGAMNYLGDVFVDFSNIMVAGGMSVTMQVGEPWWWWNVGTQKPCIYDNDTLVKFNSDTGLFAPTIDTIYDLTGLDLENTGPLDVANDTLQQSFVKWLRDELGQSTLYIKDRVKAIHPTAEMAVLLFVPSLFNDDVGFISLMNFPQAEFSSPNWDFFMTEAYDDVIKGKMQAAERAMTIPLNILNYPASKVEYLAGFVPNQELAEAFNWTILDSKYTGELWSKITGNLALNEKFNISRQYIWAYTQVAEDNFLYKNGAWDTVLDRQLIRPVQVERPARYLSFSAPTPPQIPVDPQLPVLD